MDRFIVGSTTPKKTAHRNLKSNMDRFIEIVVIIAIILINDLKSNMDRFIFYIFL